MTTTQRRAYARSYYRRRVQSLFDYLGGRCVKCDSTDDLQFDHIDPRTKQFNPRARWALSFDRIKAELDKCQLLCETCHLEKSKVDIPMVKELGRYA